jgi:PKD repeat protein
MRCVSVGLGLLLIFALAGCMDQAADKPTAQFTFSPATPAVGESITFDASASHAASGRQIVSYEWDFGDGNTDTGVITVYAYAAPGSYTVTLTVTDDKGATASARQTVTVSAGEMVLAVIDAPGSDPDVAGLAWDGQYLWVADFTTEQLSQLDPHTGSVLKTLKTPRAYESPVALTWGGGALWVATLGEQQDKLYQIDPSTGQVLRSLPVPAEVSAAGTVDGLAWDGQYLWLADSTEQKLYQIAPESGAVLKQFVLNFAPLGLAWDGQAFWVSQDGPRLWRFSPTSGQASPGPQLPESLTSPDDLAWDGEALWVVDLAFQKIYRLRLPSP